MPKITSWQVAKPYKSGDYVNYIVTKRRSTKTKGKQMEAVKRLKEDIEVTLVPGKDCGCDNDEVTLGVEFVKNGKRCEVDIESNFDLSDWEKRDEFLYDFMEVLRKHCLGIGGVTRPTIREK